MKELKGNFLVSVLEFERTYLVKTVIKIISMLSKSKLVEKTEPIIVQSPFNII